jgi:membrane protease YdiL (CAAX protease family)
MKDFAANNPVLFSILITISCLFLMPIAFILGGIMSDLPHGQNIGEGIGKVLVAIVFIIIIRRFQWLKEAFITYSGSWKNWLIILIPGIYAVLSTTYALTGSINISFSDPAEYFWITANHMGGGLVEEVVYRSLIFYCLLFAWKNRTKGTLKSGVVSAVIFGYAHMIWILLGKDFSLGFLQSTGAVCSGIFYAGVVIQTRSIWPVVVIHGLTNALAYIKITEISNFNETVSGGFMDILYSLPLVVYGLFFLWKHSEKDK